MISKKLKGFLLCLSCLFFSQGCMKGLYVMGIDQMNKSQLFKIDEEGFSEHVGSDLKKINHYTIEALKDIENTEGKKWDLYKIGIGFGLKGTFKVLNVAKISAHPRIRLWFTKDKK